MSKLHLTERDARTLTRHVVEELRLLGAVVRECGVQADETGLTFLAEVNGRLVGVYTGPGSLSYRTVACELLAAGLDHPEVGV